MTTNVDNTYERLVISGTGPYPFSFRIFDEDELTVTALESGEVDPVSLTITTHYTVTGENDEDGGSITLTALAVSLYSGFTLDIRSNTVVDQPTSIKNQGSFAPAVHEKAFDRLSRQVQDLYRQVRQKFGYPDNVDLDATMSARESWLERYLYVNGSGIIEPAIALANTLTQSIFNAFLALSDPYKRTPAEIAAGVTPTDYSKLPGELAREGDGVDGYVRSWTTRRVFNVGDFYNADFGAALQATYDYALAQCMANDGLGEGIAIMVPPNPNGGWWEQSTEVDLSSGGYCHVFGVGSPYIVATAALDYMIKFGVTNKSDRTTIENIEFDPGAQTIPAAIWIGGGTRCRISDIGFHESGAGSFTNGIDIDASRDPIASGISFAIIENIHDTGGGCITNAVVKANGLISSWIRHIRVSRDATYGVQLISGSQAIQGNTIEGLHGEPGLATNTALVRLEGTTNFISHNTIRALNGQNFVDYGIQGVGTSDKYLGNNFDVYAGSFATSALDFSGITSGSAITPLLQQALDSGTFTPVWGADSVNPAIGDGSITGSYLRRRNRLSIKILLSVGASTTFGTGDWFFTLPAALQWTVESGGSVGNAVMFDSTAGRYIGACETNGSIAPKIYVYPSGAAVAKASATVPFTWNSTDTLKIEIEMNVS